MSCPRNAFGQPNCFITAHPDHPHEQFCVTCRRRFSSNIYPPGYVYTQEASSGNIFLLVIFLLILLILFRIIPSLTMNSPRQNNQLNNEYPMLLKQKI